MLQTRASLLLLPFVKELIATGQNADAIYEVIKVSVSQVLQKGFHDSRLVLFDL